MSPAAPLLALDFDGVVVDALDECTAMTYFAGREPLPPFTQALRAVPPEFAEVFASVRPYCRTTADFMVARQLSAPVSSASEYEAARDAAGSDALAAAAEAAEAVRSRWRTTSPRDWLAAHVVAPEVLAWLRSWPGPRWIVSAKDETSIRLILRAHDAEDLVDEVVGSCDSKREALIRAAATREVLFVDDNLGHVLAGAKLPAVTARWAAWGYASREDRSIARQRGVRPLHRNELPTITHPREDDMTQTTDTTTGKQVLFVLTSHEKLGDTGRNTGAYAPEFAHPAAVFEAAGYGVSFVSVAGGEVPLDGIKDGDTVTHDFLARDDVRLALKQTPTAGELRPEDYDVVYFAGGHGTMWDFRDAADVAALAGSVYDNGGVVAAVCHGPAGLIDIRTADGTRLVDGKRVSCFTNDEESAVGLSDVVPFLLESELVAAGAIHVKADNFAEQAVADDRLVTGQNPASARRVAELVVAGVA